MYRVGILGLHHDHVWDHFPDLLKSEQVELVGAADPNQELLDKAEKYVGQGYRDYLDLLEAELPDAVLIFSSNRGGADLAVTALERGVHVMIEKPMAADLVGADAMLAAAEVGKARLMVNWPFAWQPALQRGIELALAGEIGRLWQVRYRAAHRGPEELGCTAFFCEWLFDEHLNGGGALMDYCCYGSVLARVLLGQPEQVMGVEGRFRKAPVGVEDNAILVMSYPAGMAIAEASWSEVGSLTAYVTAIHGEDGTILVEPGSGGRLIKATLGDSQGRELDASDPPPELRSGTAHFLWGIETGEKYMPLCDPVNCRDAQAILGAGRRSARSGSGVAMGERAY